jgi:hypothetical protein
MSAHYKGSLPGGDTLSTLCGFILEIGVPSGDDFLSPFLELAEFQGRICHAADCLTRGYTTNNPDLILESLATFPRRPDFYSEPGAIAFFKEHKLLDLLFDLTDIGRAGAAHKTSDDLLLESHVCDEAMKVLFMLCDASLVFTAYLQRRNLLERLFCAQLRASPEERYSGVALALGLAIVSRMVRHGTQATADNVMASRRYDRFLAGAYGSELPLLRGAAYRLTAELCVKGSDEALARTMEFYKLALASSTNALKRESGEGAIQVRQALQAELLAIVAHVTRRIPEACQELFENGRILKLFHFFQSAHWPIVKRLLEIVVNVMGHAPSPSCVMALAAELPWERLTRMLSDPHAPYSAFFDALGFLVVYPEVLDTLVANGTILPGIFGQFDLLAFSARKKMAVLLGAIAENATAVQCLRLIEVGLIRIAFELLGCDEQALIEDAFGVVEAIVAKLRIARIDLSRLVEEFSKHDAVEILGDIDCLGRQPFTLLAELGLVDADDY